MNKLRTIACDTSPSKRVLLLFWILTCTTGLAKPEIPKNSKEIDWPKEKETPKLFLKYDNKNIPGTQHLVLKGMKGPVTQNELEGLTDYFLERPLLTKNYLNTLFATWPRAYMAEWLYQQTHDRRIVDRMIEQSRSILQYRDDLYGKYPIYISEDAFIFSKGWSHFRGMILYQDRPMKLMLGIASLGTGINWPATTARTIAGDPELWEKEYKGTSYREIAKEMLNIVHESWDFTIKHYHDEQSNLLLSPPYGAEPEGLVPQWNRIFPLMAAGNTLVDTYAMLDEQNIKSTQIDLILKALFEKFWEYTRTDKVHGKEVFYYPYGVARWADMNSSHTEDTGHLGFDARGFRVFTKSGRYMTTEQLVPLANAISENVIKNRRGTFADRLSGQGKQHDRYDYWGALPPMLWFAELTDELDEKLVEYVIDLMEDKDSLDGRVVWHVLSLREQRYGVEPTTK